MADVVKADDLGFVAQLKNFSEKIGTYSTDLGLTAVQVAAIAADSAYLSFTVLGAIQAKEYGQAWTSRKDRLRNGGAATMGTFPASVDVSTPPPVVLPGLEKRFRALITTIKAHPAYNNDMGQDLGIVAANAGEELTAPTLKVKRDGETVVIGFSKGDNDGVRIYSKRGSEVAFTFLALDTKTPYVDNRPNLVPGTPEKREYYAKLFDDAAEHGDPSDTVSITL
jgi:hypothetical protein